MFNPQPYDEATVWNLRQIGLVKISNQGLMFFKWRILSSTLLSVTSTKETTTKDDIVVEPKTNTKTEDAVLLKAVNGDKKASSDQVSIVIWRH